MLASFNGRGSRSVSLLCFILYYTNLSRYRIWYSWYSA